MLSRLQFSEFEGAQRPAPPPVPARRLGGLAYLTNQYPKVSHTFIRREILALERRGWDVTRLAVRGWDAEVIDPDDVSERGKTVFALKGGFVPLLAAVMREALRSPLRFLSALWLALRMMPGSDRPFVWHLIYLAEACWFVTHLKRRAIRHIHVHFGTNPAEVAMLLNALIGIGYSITMHGPEEFDRANTLHLNEKVRRASFVAAISSFGRSQIFRAVDRRDWDKVKVVHCGIDRDYAADEIAPSHSDRFVCVGRLCEQKGQLLLVRAAAALANEGRKFKLVLVGDGDDRREIEALIAQHGLEDVVEIAGWAGAERVRREIRAARALVLPSFAEGLPVVLMEAMALGRPVLTTYVAGIPELVIDGKAGWLFPAGSEDDLVAAMRACLDTPPDALKTMGAFARSRVLARHDQDVQAGILSSLFQSVLGEKQ
jgi:colanic acid/amylovoran biosynthesis glycosyltransferase